MGELTGFQLTVFLLGLVALLLCAHLLAALAARLGQPRVIGEMLAGLLLGPTVLGQLAPGFQQRLFPHAGPAANALDGIVVLAVLLLLLVAGMEVDLSTVWKRGRASIVIALTASVVPLVLGGAVAFAAPTFWGMPENGQAGRFAIFVGTALAVSALPVIAKVLLDLDLFQSDFGMLVLVTATISNLVAWLAFSIVIGGVQGAGPIGLMVVLTVAFVVATLVFGKRLADALLSMVQAHLSWPAGVLGFMLVVGLLGAALTHAIGIHAIFGAFLTGIALGESKYMRDQTRQVVMQFVEGILAPIFVAAIGLKVNFFASFDPVLIAAVLVLGMVSKIASTLLGARVVGASWRESWALGWALNARGELGIVLALLAWQGQLINQSLFVALVTLAVVTSALAGPRLSSILQLRKYKSLGEILDLRRCVARLNAADPYEALSRLCQLAAETTSMDRDRLLQPVWEREQAMGTGIGHQVAIPHGRVEDLKSPVLVLATTEHGMAFEGVEDQPVRIIFLMLTPADDPMAQLQLMASIGRLIEGTSFVQEALAARTPVELLGVARVSEQLLKH